MRVVGPLTQAAADRAEAQAAAQAARRLQQDQDTEAKRQRDATQAANAQRQLAEANAARAEAQKLARAAVAEAQADQEARGFKAMSFDDFVLDGQKLADSETKVAVSGVYKKVGGLTLLFPDAMTVLQQRWNVGLPVWITDEASRKVRQFLLTQCDRDMVGRGCQITLQGSATMCTIHSTTGNSDVPTPCIKVEDGWNIAGP
jgi:hypothetical protein